MISSLLYISTTADHVDSGDLFAIIEASANRNPSREVTGFLVFDGQEFLQYVEGPAAALERLMESLGRDPRHHSVRILHRAERDRRLFPKWAMRRAGSGADIGLSAIRAAGLPPVMQAEVERFAGTRQAA